MGNTQPEIIDEDEDLFGFADPVGLEATEEDDIDIAEFLSTIDDSDASTIVELASNGPVADSALAVHAAALGAPIAVAPVVPLWRHPGALAVIAVGTVLLVSNLVGTWITWEKNRAVVEEIEGVRIDLRDTVASARRDIAAETSRLEGLSHPRAATLLGAVSFRTVEEHLDVGDFTTARRLLYSKLAILDRLPVAERGHVEAHTLFLLAETDHREALSLSRESGS